MARVSTATKRRLAVAILVGAAALTALRPTPPAAAAASLPITAPARHAARLPAREVAAPAPVRAAATPSTAPAPLVIRRILDTGGPLRYGTWFWDDAAPTTGALTITVDLRASVLSVFRGGDEIGTTAVIYGADAKQTPLGTFPILQKDRHHVSTLYHAPMPYMLRLTGDGISIHASAVAADYATHGCIGVPAGFAERLFAIAHVGDRVIVTNRGPVGAPSHPV